MEMASRVRAKLMRDSCNRNATLLSLVVQANLLDRLMDEILAHQQQAVAEPVREIKFEVPASPLSLPDLTPASNSSTSITEYEILSDSSDDEDYDENIDDYNDFQYDHYSQNSLLEPHTPLIQKSHRDTYSNTRLDKLDNRSLGVVVFTEEDSSKPQSGNNDMRIDYASALPIVQVC